MKRIVIKIVLIMTVLVLSNSVISCNGKQVVEKQTEYHEEIIDLERMLLNVYGDYYRIEEPQINYESKSISICCTFLTSYITDSSKNMTLLEVMEGTRVACNTFLEDNPEYFLNDEYYIHIYFYELPESYACGPIEHGSMCNTITGSGGIEPTLCNVEYYDIINQNIADSVSFDGVKQIDLGEVNQDKTDDVIKLLNRMPDVEIVRVSPPEIREKLASEFTNIDFI